MSRVNLRLHRADNVGRKCRLVWPDRESKRRQRVSEFVRDSNCQVLQTKSSIPIAASSVRQRSSMGMALSSHWLFHGRRWDGRTLP